MLVDNITPRLCAWLLIGMFALFCLVVTYADRPAARDDDDLRT